MGEQNLQAKTSILNLTCDSYSLYKVVLTFESVDEILGRDH